MLAEDTLTMDTMLWTIFAGHLIINLTSAVTAWFGRYGAALFGLAVSTGGFAIAIALAPDLAGTSEPVGAWGARIVVPACLSAFCIAAFAIRRIRINRLAAATLPSAPDYVAIGRAMAEQMDARIAERRTAGGRTVLSTSETVHERTP